MDSYSYEVNNEGTLKNYMPYPSMKNMGKTKIFTRIKYVPLNENEIKYIANKALSRVEGVIGLKKGKDDVLKNAEDFTRGIEVKINNEELIITANIITDYEHSPQHVSIECKAAIASELENISGIQPGKININIADIMTRMEFNDRFGHEWAL